MPSSIAFVFIPLIFSNIIHMLIVKYKYFSALALPINSKHFGDNKTRRGFIVLPFANAIMAVAFACLIGCKANITIFITGFFFGFAFILAELPNSYIKRRLGIAAGKQHPRYRWLSVFVDKSDSTLLVALTAYLLLPINFATAVLMYIFGFILHLILSQLLLNLQLKQSL